MRCRRIMFERSSGWLVAAPRHGSPSPRYSNMERRAARDQHYESPGADPYFDGNAFCSPPTSVIFQPELRSMVSEYVTVVWAPSGVCALLEVTLR